MRRRQYFLTTTPTIIYISQLPTMPTMDDFRVLSRHFRSESSNSIAINDDDLHGEVRLRPRARSLRYVIMWYTVPCHVIIMWCNNSSSPLLLHSPERSPREILMDLDSTHNIFKDKIPKAKEEMEEKLQVHLLHNMLCMEVTIQSRTCL